MFLTDVVHLITREHGLIRCSLFLLQVIFLNSLEMENEKTRQSLWWKR